LGPEANNHQREDDSTKPPYFKNAMGNDKITRTKTIKRYRQAVLKRVTGMRKPVPDRPSMQKA